MDDCVTKDILALKQRSSKGDPATALKGRMQTVQMQRIEKQLKAEGKKLFTDSALKIIQPTCLRCGDRHENLARSPKSGEVLQAG